MSNARKLADVVSASPTEDFNYDNGVFVVDISTNRVGVGIAAPTETLQVAGNVKVADGGTIGSATTADALTIASGGGITFSGDLTLTTNKKVQQKGACLQSSTHQVIFLGA